MLFALFCILGILHIPALRSFESYNFYDSDAGLLARSSLGNMGFSKTECLVASMLNGNSQRVRCRSGQIAQLVDWGVTVNFEDQNACARTADLTCAPVLDDELVKKTFEEECIGRAECTLSDFERFIK